MKKVRMNVSIASPDWSYVPGQEVVLRDDLAEKWAEVGHCTILEDVEKPKSKKAADKAGD